MTTGIRDFKAFPAFREKLTQVTQLSSVKVTMHDAEVRRHSS